MTKDIGKHPHLGPAMRDEAVSEVAFTDHAIAVKGRDRSETSPWAVFLKKILEGEPVDMNKPITEKHFFDVFTNMYREDKERGPDGKIVRRTLSKDLAEAHAYGQEKARQAIMMMGKLFSSSIARGPVDKVGAFQWDPHEGTKPPPEPEGHTERMPGSGALVAGRGPRVWRTEQLPHPDRFAIGHTRALGETKAIGHTKAIAPPPRALPAPPKALPAPSKRPNKPKRDDEER